MLLNGEKVASPETLMALLGGKHAGSEVTLRVRREGQQMDMKATLAERGAVLDHGASAPREHRSGYRSAPGEKTGVEKSAWLGVILEPAREGQGARIAAVYPSGPAARAGLREGDVVIRTGDQAISSPQDLQDAIEKSEPEGEMQFTIVRAGSERQFPVRLGARMMFAEPEFPTFARRDERAEGDGRDAGAAPGGRYTRDDILDSLPEHAIVLEQNRHLAIQNERLEKLLLKVLEDVQALRAEVAALKEGRTAENRPAEAGASARGGATPPPVADVPDGGRAGNR
jgi:hypothetical protein